MIRPKRKLSVAAPTASPPAKLPRSDSPALRVNAAEPPVSLGSASRPSSPLTPLLEDGGLEARIALDCALDEGLEEDEPQITVQKIYDSATLAGLIRDTGEAKKGHEVFPFDLTSRNIMSWRKAHMEIPERRDALLREYGTILEEYFFKVVIPPPHSPRLSHPPPGTW